MLYKKRPYEEREGGAGGGGAGSAGSVAGGSQGGNAAKILRTSEASGTSTSSTTATSAGPSTIGGGRGHVPNVVPPKGRVATLTRIQGGQKQVISWMDAPDDVYYKATANTKRMRKRLPIVQLRRAARKPFKKVLTLN